MQLSRGMPRYDIYMAAREALEEAYRQGLAEGRYVPVSVENLLDKLAAYQDWSRKSIASWKTRWWPSSA